MPRAELIETLLAEIKRTEHTDAPFLVGYLTGMLTTAAEKSPVVSEWIAGYVEHLQTLPDA